MGARNSLLKKVFINIKKEKLRINPVVSKRNVSYH